MSPRYRIEFLLDGSDVEVDRPLAYAEDDGYIPGGLALGRPLQDLLFPVREGVLYF